MAGIVTKGNKCFIWLDCCCREKWNYHIETENNGLILRAEWDDGKKSSFALLLVVVVVVV